MNYNGIFCEKGKLIESDKAFDYAIERILQGTEEEKSEFVDWYFSGNWIKENEGEL